MKQYFCKYIPQEGKVEIGDYFIDTGVNNLIGKRANKEREYDFQKVKFCLCSRDIKTDDEVIYIDGGSFEKRIVKSVTDVHIHFTNGGFALSNILAKVIGEISPDAIWVKKGDEFDEDQIKFQGIYDGWRVPDIIDVNKFLSENKKAEIICKIKGTCGHFH